MNTFYKPKYSYKALSLWLLAGPGWKLLNWFFFLFLKPRSILRELWFSLAFLHWFSFLKNIHPHSHIYKCIYTHEHTHISPFFWVPMQNDTMPEKICIRIYRAVLLSPGWWGHIYIARNDPPTRCSQDPYRTEHLTLNNGGRFKGLRCRKGNFKQILCISL